MPRTTDERGEVECEAVAAGEYRVEAGSGGEYVQQRVQVELGRAARVELTLAK